MPLGPALGVAKLHQEGDEAERDGCDEHHGNGNGGTQPAARGARGRVRRSIVGLRGHARSTKTLPWLILETFWGEVASRISTGFRFIRCRRGWQTKCAATPRR